MDTILFFGCSERLKIGSEWIKNSENSQKVTIQVLFSTFHNENTKYPIKVCLNDFEERTMSWEYWLKK